MEVKLESMNFNGVRDIIEAPKDIKSIRWSGSTRGREG